MKTVIPAITGRYVEGPADIKDWIAPDMLLGSIGDAIHAAEDRTSPAAVPMRTCFRGERPVPKSSKTTYHERQGLA
jgi:hypothetical protein